MKVTKTILFVSRVIVGLTFIFSGFVKAVDPVGSMIKFDEYFDAWNMIFFKDYSLFLSIALSALEFILGFALLFGCKLRLASWVALILMAGFTIQTFFLALYNPVTDCGCFGDAIKLTNWQTFYKNLVLMVLVIIIFIFRKKSVLVSLGYQWYGIFIPGIVIVSIALYGWLYMPIIDFRPYKKGNDIQKLMEIPAGAKQDKYVSVLVYKNKKTGAIVNFDENNIPMDVDTWEWQDTKTELVEKGYTPPIHDFKITLAGDIDLTDSFLNQKGYKLLIIQEKTEKSNKKAQLKINELVKMLNKDKEVKIWALTATSHDEALKYTQLNNLPYTFMNGDPVMLKTINRSNPALVLFKENTVIKHWPARCIPGYQKFINGIK